MTWNPFRKHVPDECEEHQPAPSPEALREAEELSRLRPRVERVAKERDRLLKENNYTARIRALYEGTAR